MLDYSKITTMNQLKQDLEKHLKMEGLDEIRIAVILKYMDIAYAQGQRDQIAESAKDMDTIFEKITT